MPPERGALPILFVATEDVAGNTYAGPGGLRELRGWPVAVGRSPTASDPDLAARLWARSESLTGVRCPL